MHGIGQGSAIAQAMPGTKPMPDNEATRLYGVIERVTGESERALQTVHRLHERLFGAEPRNSNDRDRQVAPPTGFLGMATNTLTEVEGQLSALVGQLLDIEKRLSA